MDTDVVIIGAGAAGLAAALRLADRAVRTIIVDARDRVGGRVLWENVGSVDVPAELGAEFIHGEAPETSALLREAGLSKVDTGNLSWLHDGDALRPDNDDFASGAIFDRVATLAADESVDTYLRRFDHEPHLREQVLGARAFVEGFEGADPALASVRSIADEIGSGVDSTSTRPAGSYAPLFDYLAARCARAGIDVRLATTVERVVWKSGEVSLDVIDAHAGRFTLRARCAIVTLPVGVLRDDGESTQVAFVPPLPAGKQTALRGLEMGQAVRVVLAFRTPFWERVADGKYRDAAFFLCEGGPFNVFWTQVPVRSRTIVAWAGGPRAMAMNGLPLQERIDRARDAFGDLFGARDLARAEFEDGVTHDWFTDPFARGAYSYVGTGAGAARVELGRPVDDTLFFAGEATSTDGQGGTVSGAFETGERAAREVIDALRIAGSASPAVS